MHKEIKLINLINMKKSIFLLLFLIVNTASFCQILYTDFIPDKYGTCLPNGHIEFINLDVNQDEQIDFKVACLSFFVPVHNGCCWNYENSVKGINSQSGFAKDATLCAKYVDSAFCFGANLNYGNQAAITMSSVNGNCTISSSTKYFPFRVIINNNAHYGWLRLKPISYTGVIIYDAAINLTPNEIICAGQIVGLNELTKNNSIKIFPNPTEGIVEYITEDYTGTLEINIRNIQGKLLFSESTIVNDKLFKANIDLTKYPDGIYFIQLITDERSGIYKIVKQ